MEVASCGRLERVGSLARSWLRREAVLLALLLVFSGVIHGWMIRHTAVAARDSIGFIRYAWQFEHLPFSEVLRKNLHPPLYPMTVLAMSKPVRFFMHAPDTVAMQLSAQLASALAGMLLVIPMFYLGRELFGRQVGFWSSALFQSLPVSSRTLSDGLTEGVFLLLIATGLLMAMRGLRKGSATRVGLCGVCAGLAYLTRPEGFLLLASAGLVLLAMQAMPSACFPWRTASACGLCLVLGAASASLPYMIVIGGFSNKTTANWITDWIFQQKSATLMEEDSLDIRVPMEDGDLARRASDASAPPGAMSFSSVFPIATWLPTWKEGQHDGTILWSLTAFVKEVGKGFHYIIWAPTLLGLWWFRGRFRVARGAWVMLVLCLLQALLLLHMGVVAGYISERHSLLFVLCGSFWAVACVREIPRRLSVLASRVGMPTNVANWGGCRSAVEVVLLTGLIVYGLPSTLKTLHPSRAGFRAAGFWLGEHADPADDIRDPFCWSKYYAGRDFVDRPATTDNAATTYVVLDTSSHHTRQPELANARKLAQQGTVVYHWPEKQSLELAPIKVYRVTGAK